MSVAQRLEELGFERIYLHHVARDQSPFLELAERDLLPALHEAGAATGC